MKINTDQPNEDKKIMMLSDLMGNSSCVIEEEFNAFMKSFRASPLNDDLIRYLTGMVDISLAQKEGGPALRKEASVLAGFDSNKTMFLEGARQVLSLIKYIAGK